MSSRTLPSNVNLSKNTDASTSSKVAQSTSDKLEIYSDFAVWDTVQNRYLQPRNGLQPRRPPEEVTPKYGSSPQPAEKAAKVN